MHNKDEKQKNSSVREKRVKADKIRWDLCLFIAGHTIKSIAALNNLKLICEDKLKGQYHIEIIDLLKNPELARENQILAIPTLVRKMPLPVKNIIGDLSDKERVLASLDLIEHCAA